MLAPRGVYDLGRMLIERQPRNATPRPAERAPRSRRRPALAEPLEALGRLLVEQGQCDARGIERGRRVAAETGQRLDAVLMHLGLVTERGLAQAYAALLGLPVAGPRATRRSRCCPSGSARASSAKRAPCRSR